MFAPFAQTSGGLFPPLTQGYLTGMAWLVLLATYGGWLIYYLLLRLYPPDFYREFNSIYCIAVFNLF